MQAAFHPLVLETLLQSLPAFALSLRREDLSLLSISEGVRELTGFDCRDLLAYPDRFAGRLHPADRKSLARLLSDAAVSEGPFVRHDFRFRCANGTDCWFRACLCLLPGPPDAPTAAAGIVRSVEEERDALGKARIGNRILHAVDAPVAFADPDGVVRSWNDAAERFFGWKREEMCGAPLHRLFPLPPDVVDGLLRRARSDGSVTREDRLVTRAGEVPCRVTISLVRGRDEEAAGLAVTVAGTAEFRGVENRLQELITRLRTIEQVNRIIASDWDVRKIHARIVPELDKLVDFDRTSLAAFEEEMDPVLIAACAKGKTDLGQGARIPLDRSAAGWVLVRRIPRIDDDMSVSGDTFAEDATLIREGMRSRLVIPLFCGERVVGTLDFHSGRKGAYSLAAVEALGSIPEQLALAINQFQTYAHLRKSEERYRLLFEQGPAAAIVGWDGRIVEANQGAMRLFGYSREEASRVTVLDINALPEKAGRQQTVLATGKPIQEEVLFRKKDGSRFWGWLNLFPVSKDLVFAQVIDLTGQKELEEQLLHAQKMEAVGTLAGGIAHDFNNIIQAILGYASLLKGIVGESGEAARKADAIENAALRAAELTSQLLGFARGGKYRVQATDPNEVVERVAAIIRPTFDRSIDIRTEKGVHGWAVEGDPGQLEQALLNLAINARDAMPGGGTLSIGTSLEPASAAGKGPFVLLTVSDSGAGILPEHLPRIFEPFFTTKEAGKGTGMGLAMVYGIVKNHGGSVDAQSEPGKGATFRIRLPASSARPVSSLESPAEEPLPQGTGTILFVDDEESLRLLAEEMLGGLGYRVLSAGNGLEALRLFAGKKNEIDLVILDMIMPEMGGEETFRRIREISPSARILVSSGCAREGEPHSLLREGAAGLLRKPYRLAALASAVRTALHDES